MNTLIAVTGASGFIGSAVIWKLESSGLKVLPLSRETNLNFSFRTRSQAVGEITGLTDWSQYLGQVSIIVHAAARAYVMRETEADALAAYRAVNVDGTRRLAEQAVESGVKRLVYLSSIKVNGERTSTGGGLHCN